MIKLYKNLIFLFFTALTFGLTACIDDKFPDEPDEFTPPRDITDGFSISFKVTLDNMGGETSTRSSIFEQNSLVEIENYINPEMFRVFFFNKDNLFLFESKSRWVTQRQELDGGNEWHVSVPVFTYGNDDPNYDWPRIREELTSGKFKIAILANRPTEVKYPEFEDVGTGGITEYYYPNWDHKDSWVRTIYDFHHCAYDPIYEGKSKTEVELNGTKEVDFYDFIMKNYGEIEEDSGYDANDHESQYLLGPLYICIEKGYKDNVGKNTQSYAKEMSKDNPIAMYGVQEFDPLLDWEEGTTYNLSELESMHTNYECKSISLLRSLVKLELLVPKSLPEPTFIAVRYSNVYARTEPMDVWTPTDQLWKDDHNDCESKYLLNYGQYKYISNDNKYNQDSKQRFQEELSWYYGAWKDFNWNFGDVKVPEATDATPYPRIFNSCIQRNATVYIRDKNGVHTKNVRNGASDNEIINGRDGDIYKVPDNLYHRYIYYTGEKNINDISNLGKYSGECNILYWVVSFEEDELNHYVLPITDYSNPANPLFQTKFDDTRTTNNYPGPIICEKKEIPFYDAAGKKDTSALDKADPAEKNTLKAYMDKIRLTDYSNNPELLPWPLLRNHVYRLTITSLGSDNSDGHLNVITVDCQDRYSPTIEFN